MLVLFRNSQDDQGRGTLVQVSRHQAVFESYNPYSLVQLSEVLEDFQVWRGERAVYRGRAVVSNLMNTGLTTIVSVALVDPWAELSELTPGAALQEEVSAFVAEWEARVSALEPPFQAEVGKMASFCQELRRWLAHTEMAVDLHQSNGHSHGNGHDHDPSHKRTLDHAYATRGSRGVTNGHRITNGHGGTAATLPQAFAHDVSSSALPKLRELMASFEEVSRDVPPPALPAHKEFAQRELHPLLLCSPFIHRTFTKPLGYAGDYEMVNMMLRDPWEGQTTYAQIINALLIQAAPAEGHRNRIARLVSYLEQAAARHAGTERDVRILNVGCGPAVEVQRFIRESEISQRCHFDLVDFNEETLHHARQAIDEAIYESRHRPNVHMIHESIHDLLKRASQSDRRMNASTAPRARGVLQTSEEYDLIYCAGLFDYLSDRICKRLLKLFLAGLAPDGLIVTTNVHPSNPIRHFMEHLLEWNLVHRDEAAMRSLVPARATASISPEPTGTNVFLEVRPEVQ